MTELPNILNAGLAWMLMGNAMRFAAVGGDALVPVGKSAWACLWCKKDQNSECVVRFHASLDGMYMRLLSALTTTASAALVYAGMLFMGTGLLVRTSASVLRYMGGDRAMWDQWSQVQNGYSVPLLVVGMCCIVAAVSRKRTASVVMSAGFVVAGLGMGVVVAAMGAR